MLLNKGKKKVKISIVSRKLRTHMKINDEIISLIYGNSVRNINLKLNNQDSKENLLKHIKIYNNLKTVIANCKNDK